MKRKALILPLFLLFIPISLVEGNTGEGLVWLRKGAYVRYTSPDIPQGRILFSNGTMIWYSTLNLPSILQWEVIDVLGKIVRLKLTFALDGKATIINGNSTTPLRDVAYSKTLLVDVDIQTEEAFIDNESIGKVSFWVEQPVAEGVKIQLSSPPSDSIYGNVTGLEEMTFIGRRINSCYVEVLQLSPYAFVSYVFDRETGIALQYTLLGSVEILPNSTHIYRFPNGTAYNITAYAKTKLAERLGLEGRYQLALSETNIELGGPIQSTNAQIYIIVFTMLFISLATAFIYIDRKKRRPQKSHMHR